MTPRVLKGVGSEPRACTFRFAVRTRYSARRWTRSSQGKSVLDAPHNVGFYQVTMSQLWSNFDECDPFCVTSSPQDDRRTVRCKTQLRKSCVRDTTCAR